MKSKVFLVVLLITSFFVLEVKAHNESAGKKKLSCPRVLKICTPLTGEENGFPLCKSCCTSKSKDSKCIKRCLKKCPPVSSSSSSGGTIPGGDDNQTPNDG